MITVVEALDRLGIAYMLTGSLVSSYYGEPRSTHDIDVVVEIESGDVASLAAEFRMPRYYLVAAAASEVIGTAGLFSLLEIDEGEKVDFWPLTGEPFDCSRFDRRRDEVVFGTRMSLPSPEDCILAKLHWARLSGGSEKQFGDALRVFELQHAVLDQAYLDTWATQIGVADGLRRLRDEAEPVQKSVKAGVVKPVPGG